MNRDTNRTRIPNRHRRVLAASLTACAIVLAGLASLDPASANSLGSICELEFDADAPYPPLPASWGLDMYARDGVVLFLQTHRGVVQLDGCLYELDRPLELDAYGLDHVSLLIELPDHSAGAQVYVTTEDGVLLEVLDINAGAFEYLLTEGLSLGFGVATPGEPLPTIPVVITKPIDDDPEPS